MILGNTPCGIADEADVARLDVGKSANEIHHLALGVGIKRVDRQIPPFGIRPPVCAEGNLGVASVGLDVGAKGRHLEGLAVDHERHRAVLQAGWDCLDA